MTRGVHQLFSEEAKYVNLSAWVCKDLYHLCPADTFRKSNVHIDFILILHFPCMENVASEKFANLHCRHSSFDRIHSTRTGSCSLTWQSERGYPKSSTPAKLERWVCALWGTPSDTSRRWH